MAQPYRNIGAIEAADAQASVNSADGAYMDYDTVAGNARFGAKGGAGTNRGLLIRTLLAGAVVNAIAITAAGVITLAAALNAQAVSATTLTFTGSAYRAFSAFGATDDIVRYGSPSGANNWAGLQGINNFAGNNLVTLRVVATPGASATAVTVADFGGDAITLYRAITASSGLTVSAGGITVSAGTSAFQAMTATNLTLSGGLTLDSNVAFTSNNTWNIGGVSAGSPANIYVGTSVTLGTGSLQRGALASVAGSATTIYTSLRNNTVFAIVEGDSGANQFTDLVVYACGGSVSVISSGTTAGAPAARTYTVVGNSLKLSLASSTWAVRPLPFEIA